MIKLDRKSPLVSLADQVLSSGTNFAAIFLAARLLGAESFGEFSIAYGFYVFVIGFVRSFLGESILVSARNGLNQSRREYFSSAAALGLAGGVLAVAITAVFPAIEQSLIAVTVVAVTLPILSVLEIARIHAFSQRNPWSSCRLDGWWIFYLVPSLVLVAILRPEHVAWILAVWTMSGIAALASWAPRESEAHPGAHPQLLRLPSPRPAIDGTLRVGGKFYAMDFALGFGATQVVAILIAAVLDLETAGVVRLSLAVFGPINIAFTGLALHFVPGLAANLDVDRSVLSRVRVGAAVLCAAWGMAIYFVSQRFLNAELAEGLGTVVPWMTVGYIALGLASVDIIRLRATADSRRLALGRAMIAPFLVGLPFVGAMRYELAGYAAGFAASAVISLIVWQRMKAQSTKVLGLNVAQ